MISAIGVLVDQYHQLKAIEQVTFVAGVLSLLSLPILSWARALFRLRSSRKYAADLERVNAALRLQRDHALTEAATERDKAARWMPDIWMNTAKHEREQGNEELAISALRSGFERVRLGMSHTSLALAGHHLSMIVGTEPAANLAEGERHAQLAVLLDPDDADAAFLLEDARAIRAEGQEALTPVATPFLPANQDEAVPTIEAILAEADRQNGKGLYRVAVRLVRRARLIAERAGIARHELGLQVEHDFATALQLCGKYAEALDVVTIQLPVTRRILGDEHLLTLALRVLEGVLLDRVGLYREALDRLWAVIPALERTLGVEHPIPLAARNEEVETLISLGQARLAVEKITSLLEIKRRTLRKLDRQLLAARFLEVKALDQFGDHSEALERVKPLLHDHRGLLGDDHPNVLTIGLLEAEILANLGEYNDALSKTRELLPTYVRLLGTDHPFVYVSRAHENRILNELGEHSEALARAVSLEADFERVLGAQHSDSLIFRRERVQYRIETGDLDGVVEEVEDILAHAESRFDHCSKVILSARLTHASALAGVGREGEAAEEIKKVSALLEANFAATHFLAVRARALEAKLPKCRTRRRRSADRPRYRRSTGT